MKRNNKSEAHPAMEARFRKFFFPGTISCNHISKKGQVTEALSVKNNYAGLVGSFRNLLISMRIEARSGKTNYSGLAGDSRISFISAGIGANSLNSWIPGISVPRLLVIAFFVIMLSGVANAQELPPRPIVVVPTAQTLSFGAFTPGSSGGTVTVSPGSLRSSTGTVIRLSLGFAYSSALFEITANPGTLISILDYPSVVLPGSGGGSMTLTIDSTNPVSPFVTSAIPPNTTSLYIGGTLSVGNILVNPPGDYSGTFNITFIQE